jgi:toxin-antitoxin system PIN domain toxin
MILPDVNLLVYAHNVRDPRHPKALAWWSECLSGQEGVALAWAVIHGFVRVTTHPRVFERPLTVEESLSRVEEWMTLPHVHLVEPPRGHFQTWAALLRELGTAGNLSTDAHLAALAMERGLILHTTDADFSRFPGLKWRNPLR